MVEIFKFNVKQTKNEVVINMFEDFSFSGNIVLYTKISSTLYTIQSYGFASYNIETLLKEMNKQIQLVSNDWYFIENFKKLNEFIIQSAYRTTYEVLHKQLKESREV